MTAPVLLSVEGLEKQFHLGGSFFGAGAVDVAEEINALIYHLTDLDVKIRYTPLNAQGLLDGTARLAYEVGESKADGGESRYSGTSLDDMRNNVAGIQLAYAVIFAAAVEAVRVLRDTGTLRSTL